MKENTLDVLLYLVEHYMDGERGQQPPADENDLRDHLLEAGFGDHEVSRAFAWLDDLSDEQRCSLTGPDHHAPLPQRIYTDNECRTLNSECRGFLHMLEQGKVINAAQREMVIHSALSLDSGELSLDSFKWILLMVLYNQPDEETNHDWLEELVFDHQQGTLH